MKIVDSRRNTQVPFSRIEVGECCIVGTDLMMRIESFEAADGCVYDAILLEDGSLCGINSATNVDPVKAGITIYE